MGRSPSFFNRTPLSGQSGALIIACLGAPVSHRFILRSSDSPPLRAHASQRQGKMAAGEEMKRRRRQVQAAHGACHMPHGVPSALSARGTTTAPKDGEDNHVLLVICTSTNPGKLDCFFLHISHLPFCLKIYTHIYIKMGRTFGAQAQNQPFILRHFEGLRLTLRGPTEM